MGKGKFKNPIRFDLRKIFMSGFVRITATLLPYAITLGFAALLFGASYAFAMQSDLFTLREVSISGGKALSPQAAASYTGLRIGEKLLSIDLGRIERFIRERNPEFREVIVQRVLPSGIKLHLKRRIPLAQIHQDGMYYLIDHDGYVISEPQTAPFGALPAVRGARVPKNDLRKGSHLNRFALNQAVQLMRDIKSFDVLKGHKLSVLDISDANNFVMWIDEKIEVRIASRNFTSQLQKISDAFSTMQLDPERIAYIDLRFDDIVIGQK